MARKSTNIKVLGLNSGLVQADVDIRLSVRKTKDITRDVFRGLQKVFIEFGEKMTKSAARISIEKGVFDTGFNTSSIGYAISKFENVTYTSLKRNGGGFSSTAGLKSDKNELTMAMATSSGYGGYQELGTATISPRPYLTPGVLENIENFKRALKGSV